jgi:hypothetical protein
LRSDVARRSNQLVLRARVTDTQAFSDTQAFRRIIFEGLQPQARIQSGWPSARKTNGDRLLVERG